MTDSSANMGMGTILSKSSIPIVAINSIGRFGSTRQMIDVTAYDSDDDAEEYIAGIIQARDLTVSGFLVASDSSGQIAAINTDYAAGTRSEYVITLPNTEASTFTFDAIISSWEIDPQLKGPIGISITFKVMGKPVFAV